MNEAAIMSEFNVKFSYLRAHPDRNIIIDLTEFAKQHIALSYHIVGAMVHRLQDPLTDTSFKLPILYLADAIMKKVGGTYPEYFSKPLVAVVQRAMLELSQPDRKKLAVLIQTWEERRLMPADALGQMSAIATTASAQLMQLHIPPAGIYNPANPVVAQHIAIPMPSMPIPMPMPMPMPMPAPVQPYVSNIVPPPMPYNVAPAPVTGHKRPSRFQPASSSSLGPGPPPAPVPSNAAILNEMVQAEMNTLLVQLLRDIGAADMTLQELSNSNPSLYMEIRKNAEAQARVKYDAAVATGSGLGLGVATGAIVAPGLPGAIAAAAQYGGPRRPPGVRIAGLPSAAVARGPPQMLGGFVSEVPVQVDVFRAEALDRALLQLSGVCGGGGSSAASGGAALDVIATARVAASVPAAIAQGVALAATKAHAQLHPLLCDASAAKVRPLPAVLFGPIPLEPSSGFVASQSSVHRVIKKVLRKVVFRPDELGRNANAALQGLYIDRSFRFEDGVRFKSQFHLNAHIDAYAGRRRAEMRAEQARSKPPHREWYWRITEWISNARAADAAKEEGALEKLRGRADKAEEEFIVPADEHFTRCPVSKEVFETVWNDEEGGFMYRHAARVLVTQLADKAVYKLGQPTEDPSVKYVVAHKLLVVNDWLSAGRCATLKDAMLRYGAMGKARADVDKLRVAAGADEDDEYVFVMLEHLS